MPQPPNLPLIAHENVRAIPALSQRTFQVAAADALQTFIWEFDLAARITDPNQFLSALAAPAGSTTIAGGGAGPQTTPQPAIGPLMDALAFTSGAGGGTLLVEYAVDANPCRYRQIANSAVPAGIATNISGLRVTGRFVRITFTNVTAAATVEVGYYIRNT
jgi:hypothetical protein